MATQNFAEFLGSLHRLTDITLEEVEDCFNGAGFTDEYCESIVNDFKCKSEEEIRKEAMERWQKENDEDVDEDAPSETKTEVDEELDEKLRIFSTRLRNVFNINSNIALINDGT